MQSSFLYNTSSISITICLTLGIILFYYMGYVFKLRRADKNHAAQEDGFGAIQGSLLGLLALLLSFTFGMASSRHENRYQVMVQEANCIGTAILRADLFPDSVRSVLRKDFRGYVDARIDLYNAGIDPEKNNAAAAKTDSFSARLWKLATAKAQEADMVERNRGSLMVPALNDMIDAVTTRKASRETMIPESILWLLFLLCLSSGFIVGYGTRRKIDWIMVGGFSLMVAITVFSILDLDRPHRGLITLDDAEQNIADLLNLLK